MTAANFIADTIGSLAGTSINTLYWQLGTDPFKGTAAHRLSDWYSHDTRIGAVWGADRTAFKTAGEWRAHANDLSLRKEAAVHGGRDAVSLLASHARKARLDFFLSLRINDGSDGNLADGFLDSNLSPLRKRHPQWLLGSEAANYWPDATPDGKSRFAYDFGIAEVRQYTLALIDEAITHYDLDGFDIDFCRQPVLFRRGVAQTAGELMTTLLRDTRKRLDAKALRIQRPLYLSVRVPHDLTLNLRAGLDVPAWISQGLVDIVVVSDPRGWNYRLPVEDFLDLAKNTRCKVIAQNLCGFHEDRGRSSAVLFGGAGRYTPAQYRAVAANHWQAGTQGQFIWNQHFLPYMVDRRIDLSHWKDIGDPALLARRDKHYLVGPTDRGGNLPQELPAAGHSREVIVEVADDFGSAATMPPTAVLRLMIEQLTSLDDIAVELNGYHLARDQAQEQINYNDCWLDFDALHCVRKGSNQLKLEVRLRNPHVNAPLTLRAVEMLVSYSDQAISERRQSQSWLMSSRSSTLSTV